LENPPLAPPKRGTKKFALLGGKLKGSRLFSGARELTVGRRAKKQKWAVS